LTIGDLLNFVAQVVTGLASAWMGYRMLALRLGNLEREHARNHPRFPDTIEIGERSLIQ